MSIERKTITRSGNLNELTTTSFFGGVTNGACLQVTQIRRDGTSSHGFIAVDKHQAIALIAELSAWLTSHSDVSILEQ